MSHCKIHRVQHLNVSRAADTPAEWINNNLRSAEIHDADEARTQRDHLVFGNAMNNNALPPGEVMDALIKMRANAETLIEHGGSQEIWAMYEDSLMRHCHLFLKRTKAWHKTREW